MRRIPFLGVLAAIPLALGMTACGADDGDASDVQDRISEQLQDGGAGLDAEQADCLAGLLIDEVGADELNDVDLSAEEPPAELQEKFAAAATAALDECDLDATSLAG